MSSDNNNNDNRRIYKRKNNKMTAECRQQYLYTVTSSFIK